MRPRAVSREQIVAAADMIARRDGIGALTMRRLCAELGVTAPAVYRHFPAKELIEDQVIDDVIRRIDLPGPEAGDWADRLRRCFVSAHDVVAPYGGLAARMAREMPRSPSVQRNTAYLRELLAGAGLGEDDAVKVVVAVFVYVWGHLLAAEAAGSIGLTGAASPPAASASARGQFLWGLDHMLSSIRREFDGRLPQNICQDKSVT
jgi:AcrR family transcriptional regulator